MGKIIVTEFISLDGVIETPHHWHFPYVSDDMQAEVNAGVHASDAFLYGRVTYEEFAPFWSTQTDNAYGIGDKLNETPKYVVTTTLESVDWNNSHLLKGNLVEEINRLKQQISGNIGMTGSGKLIQSLMQHDLVDELRLMIHPIVVGKGKRLFKDGMDTAGLKLVETKIYSAGVIDVLYARDRSS
jgi:dihydrofolate reductase